MEQDKTGRVRSFWLGAACLAGICCGCMMSKLQLSPAAVSSAVLVRAAWERMSEFSKSGEDLIRLGLKFFCPGAVMILLIDLFSLWMVGQPFICLLFSLLGLFCGLYGTELAASGRYLLAGLWYAPFAAGYFFLILPVGRMGLDNCLKLRQEQKLTAGLRETAVKSLIRIIGILFLSFAAAGSFLWAAGVLF